MVEWLGGKPLSCNGNEVQSLSWILSHAIIASQPGCKQVALATRCRTHNMLGLKWMILATLNWWTQGKFIKYSTLGAIRRQHHSNWRLTQKLFETSIFHIISFQEISGISDSLSLSLFENASMWNDAQHVDLVGLMLVHKPPHQESMRFLCGQLGLKTGHNEKSRICWYIYICICIYIYKYLCMYIYMYVYVYI